MSGIQYVRFRLRFRTFNRESILVLLLFVWACGFVREDGAVCELTPAVGPGPELGSGFSSYPPCGSSLGRTAIYATIE